MAVSAINITRVSNNLQTMSLLESLRQNTLSLFLQQNRLSTGNKLNAPSDDPVGANRALNLTEMLEHQEQILANIQYGDSFLSATDTAIGTISDLLIQAKSIALEMVESTASQSQRDSEAELIKGIIDELVRIGNRDLGGTFLFGGRQITQQPFVQESGGVIYRGDLGELLTHVDLQHDVAMNLNGADLFGALSSRVLGYADLNPAISTETRLVDLRGAAGRGVQPGLVQVALSAPGVSFVVDLAQADDAGDVVSALNAAAAGAGLTVGPGNDFNASLTPNGIQLSVGGGTVTVSEVGAGTTARDLGILGTGAGMLVGQDLDPLITGTTPVAALFGGGGAVLQSIRLANGTLVADVDLSSAQTVQDILNAINNAGVQVQARINDSSNGIDVLNRLSGSLMSIGENGADTANLLGIRSLYADTPLTQLNNGAGITTMPGKDDFRIIAKDGGTVDVSLDGARTIQDVLDRINAAATAAGVNVNADLAAVGNGIRINDNTGGGGTLQIQKLNLSPAIDGLGLNVVADPAATEIVGSDINAIRPDSIFTALQDLYSALKRGDTAGITDAGGRVGGFVDQVNRLQGMVGARSQAMSARYDLTEDAVTTTKKLLSDAKDLDWSEAVTQFQLAQTALQANLMTGSRLLQMSLLDFLS